MNLKKMLSLLVSISMLAGYAVTGYAAETDEVTTVIAASDFQHSSGTTQAAANMSYRLGKLKDGEGITTADGFLFAGDYDYNYGYKTQTNVEAVKEVMADTVTDNMVFVQGNHDVLSAKDITPTGPADHSEGKYGVYVLNEEDYTGYGGDPEHIKQTAQGLADYLNVKLQERWDKPIFVVSHVQLHYSMRTRLSGEGAGKYANYIFDVLNEAGKKGLNIFFLFGHNHSKGWDDYLGGGSVYLPKGHSILVPQASTTVFKQEKLNFTYLNAGYVGYYKDVNTGADGTLTLTSYKISDDSVQIARYGKNGIHNLKCKGVTNSHMSETGYSPDTSVYASPQTVELTDVIDTSPIFIDDIELISNDYSFKGNDINVEAKFNVIGVSTAECAINGQTYQMSLNESGTWCGTVSDGIAEPGDYTLTISGDTDSGEIVQSYDYTVMDNRFVVVPSVIFNAGTQASPFASYTGSNGIILQASQTSQPHKNVKYGFYTKLEFPELPEDYEIKNAQMLGGVVHADHYSNGVQGGSTYFVPLTETIDGSYTYYTDTANYPKNNLSTITPTNDNAYVFKGKFYQKENEYADIVTDTYDVTMDIKSYLDSLYAESSNKELSESLLITSSRSGGLCLKGKGMTNPVSICIEVGEKLNAEFISPNYAHAGDGFGVALDINTNSENVQSVVINVNGVDYNASLNADDDWTVYVENGFDTAGTYDITATVTDKSGATTEKTQSFTVHEGEEFIKGSYVVKRQSSDSKIWSVSSTAGYTLKTSSSSGEPVDTLYTAMSLSTITNTDAIDKIYFITSSGDKVNGYTDFVIEECSEVSSSTLKGGEIPETLPTIGNQIIRATYSKSVIGTDDEDYAEIAGYLPLKANTTAHYMKFDATEYIKNLVNNGQNTLYFRTSVKNSNGENYAISNNNAQVRLFIKYKDPVVVDNYNGTFGYLVDSADYVDEGSVCVIMGEFDETGRFNNASVCETLNGRKRYVITDDNKDTRLFIWNNISDIKPLATSVKIK